MYKYLRKNHIVYKNKLFFQKSNIDQPIQAVVGAGADYQSAE